MTPNWRDYYSREAEISDFNPEDDPSEIQRCLAAWSVLPKVKNMRVLDVGSGDGFFCHWLKKRRQDFTVEGMDISGPRLRRARRRYNDMAFREGALPELPIESNAFDLVTCIEVLEHLVDVREALRELARVSRRFVLITVPDREELRDLLCPHCLQKFPASGHLHRFERGEVAGLLSRAGMGIAKAKIYYPPIGATTGRIPVGIGKVLRLVYNWVDPRPGSYIAALGEKRVEG